MAPTESTSVAVAPAFAKLERRVRWQGAVANAPSLADLDGDTWDSGAAASAPRRPIAPCRFTDVKNLAPMVRNFVRLVAGPYGQ